MTNHRPTPSPPPQLHLDALVAVAVGGLFGAAARQAVEQGLPTAPAAFPLTTVLINLVGALLLGALLEGLARAGDDRGRRRRIRLVAGTGFLGAFTTYSTFAIEADLLVHAGHPLRAALYVAVTVAAGLVTVVAGIAVAAGGHRRRAARLPLDPDIDASVDRDPGAGRSQ